MRIIILFSMLIMLTSCAQLQKFADWTNNNKDKPEWHISQVKPGMTKQALLDMPGRPDFDDHWYPGPGQEAYLHVVDYGWGKKDSYVISIEGDVVTTWMLVIPKAPQRIIVDQTNTNINWNMK